MLATQLRPLGIGEILDVAIKIAWRNAATLVRVVLVVVVPVTVVANLIIASAGPSTTFDIRETSSGVTITRHAAATYVVAILISVVLSWLGGLIATGAAFQAVTEAYLGTAPNWRRSLAFAGRRLHSLLWVSVLGGFLTLLGFVLCLVPGLYLAIAFTIAVPVLLTEELRGRRALGRARRLVSGRWWPAAALVALGWLVTAALRLGLGELFSLGFTHGIDRRTVAGFTARTVSDILVRLVTTPFTVAYVTVLYYDLRVRKEGFDLQLLAERVGVDPVGLGPGLLEPPPPEPSDDDDQPPYWPPPPGWRPRGGG